MDAFHEYWIRQPESIRRAAGYGKFILNQPELDLRWGEEEQPIIEEVSDASDDDRGRRGSGDPV